VLFRSLIDQVKSEVVNIPRGIRYKRYGLFMFDISIVKLTIG
jgi:hypothetical protein